jgi:Domain of unknown function (DUF932).
MARPIINSPRMLRTGQPLTLEQIKSVAPAVFASGPHESRGPRYAYVPTIAPLQTLLDSGWHVYEAAQQRARAADRDPYTKHMLRMRKESLTKHTDGVPEVILINGHDGSASYRLIAGYFRFVCCNGLMVGSHISSFTVRHTVGPQTSDEVLRAGEKTITEKFPAMMEQMEKWRKITLSDAAAYSLAKTAVQLRYGDTVPPFKPAELLLVRRDADRAPTLWNTLNRIQENIMGGGWETRSAMFGRKSTVRPVERVSAVAKINGGLWDAAFQLAEEA